jgi:hypothetical protein
VDTITGRTDYRELVSAGELEPQLATIKAGVYQDQFKFLSSPSLNTLCYSCQAAYARHSWVGL